MMPWSLHQKRGLRLTLLGTAVMTALTLLYLWMFHAHGVALSSFLAIAAVIAVVWFAIGAVMAFFIVMIIRKNERIGKDQ